MPSHVNLKTKNHISNHKKILKKRLEEFKGIKGLIGIVLNGGLSRGYSDDYSEIDILLYLEEEYYRYYQTHKTPFEIGISMDQGQLYDISLVSYQKELKKDWDSLMCWDRSHAEILFEQDQQITNLYQEKLKQGPPLDDLSGLLFSAYWYISIAGDVWIHRKDALQGHHLFNQALIPLIKCLFLLNKEHIPHEKWIIHLSKSLEHLPNDYEHLLTKSFLVENQSLETLIKRQKELKKLYAEVNILIKKNMDYSEILDATYEYHVGVLDYLITHKTCDKQEFLEKFGIGILNSPPFYPCVTIKEDTITLDKDKLVTIQPSEAYAWFYKLVDYAKNNYKENI